MTDAARWPLTDYHDDTGGEVRQEPRLKLPCRLFFFGDDDFEVRAPWWILRREAAASHPPLIYSPECF